MHDALAISRPSPRPACLSSLLAAGALGLAAILPAQGPPRLLGWNDLGMHCMDGDTSVFSILPPFNTLRAQLIVGGQLVESGTYSVTYEAVADPTGSINRTSVGKTDFWLHAQALFGATLVPDEGLAGFRMPGLANTPQAMAFLSGDALFRAEGIPMTPYDDTGAMRPYPLLRLVAHNGQGQTVASTDVVVPVSAEMACTSCHGSGTDPAARPAAGWTFGPAATDDRWNILKLHDERHLGSPVYGAALQGAGYLTAGLFATASAGTPILCARCHATNALGTAGQPGVPTMTSAMHLGHASARLPDGRRLDDVQDRSSCYTCHPGAATRCLRGAMGKAIGADGESRMSCQDCHGSMAMVGDPARTGWLQEPNCQSCHTGDAVSNTGAIRFDNVFDTPGHFRTTPNQRFATAPNTPLAGFSLYRFSEGHGGLDCAACHGSPHAIWPSTETNDNLQSLAAQGHVGTINECSACHSNLEDDQQIGPHGMHPTGNAWVGKHGDIAEQNGTASCKPCHGATYRGTVLSRSHGNRVLNTQFGTKNFWRGYEVGCYDCHNGPNSESASTNSPPVVSSPTIATPTDTPVSLTLAATDANQDPRTLRIVDQPKHGAVAFDGTTATYRARDGYVGTDSFTYAAGDTKSNSNLGTVTVQVGAPACAGSATPFGFGCGDPAGNVPRLRMLGCPTGGNTVTLVIDQIPTDEFALLALGEGQGPIELAGDGCMGRMSTLLALTSPIPVVGGRLDLVLPLPASLGSWDGTMQAVCLNANAPRSFVVSPGLAIQFR